MDNNPLRNLGICGLPNRQEILESLTFYGIVWEIDELLSFGIGCLFSMSLDASGIYIYIHVIIYVYFLICLIQYLKEETNLHGLSRDAHGQDLQAISRGSVGPKS